MATERTFVMLKPDAVERRLIGELIRRIEQKNLNIVALKMMRIERKLAETHYGEHREKPFFRELVDFVTGGPAVAMIVEGPNAISVMRAMMGATNPFNAAPGTVRGDLGLDLTENLIHGSDSPESAKREITLFFGESPSP
ncbi:nucleoside-diphosphate kinase [Candidatus Acetothermia bacterium]|jgi:nucleoside-diphosphate kinase|nr:nucleoside-diphosphate kinase [Candidatus Acetothermia bacterium]MCI2431085.1 nucleoside-diphosphate kinase [Candidatus Acetothermia bacterium]MCI2435709.1 nucleoside-diphosphate kinase [Candidatus Acetothermia bacterium]